MITEKLACIRDQATSINAPCPELVHGTSMAVAQGAAANLIAGQERVVESQVDALLRRNVRRGPDAAHNIAMRIRRDELPMDGDEAILSRIVEHGVTIEERSNGERDRILVTVGPEAAEYGALYQGTPASFADPANIVANVYLDNTGWPLSEKPVVVDGKATFSIPADVPPDRIRVTFANAANTAWWDNNLLHYGDGHRPALSSIFVRAELDSFAQRHGRKRASKEAAGARAVTNHRPLRVRRSKPILLERLQTAEDLRRLKLEKPRAPRRS